jgi:hypothetical protein
LLSVTLMFKCSEGGASSGLPVPGVVSCSDMMSCPEADEVNVQRYGATKDALWRAMKLYLARAGAVISQFTFEV